MTDANQSNLDHSNDLDPVKQMLDAVVGKQCVGVTMSYGGHQIVFQLNKVIEKKSARGTRSYMYGEWEVALNADTWILTDGDERIKEIKDWYGLNDVLLRFVGDSIANVLASDDLETVTFIWNSGRQLVIMDEDEELDDVALEQRLKDYEGLTKEDILDKHFPICEIHAEGQTPTAIEFVRGTGWRARVD